MTEGSDAVFKLTRTGDTDDALTVALSASETGSMISGAAPTSVTFAAEASETELRIPAAADTTDEDDSTLTVTPTAGDTYPLDTNEQRTAALTVLDDDAAELPGGTVAVAGTTVWTADMTVTDYGNGSIGAGTASLLANPAHGARRVPARHEYVDEVVDPATQRPGPDLVADARTNGERLKHGLLLGPLTLGTRRDHAYYVKLAVAPMPATPGARALARRELVITRRWSYPVIPNRSSTTTCRGLMLVAPSNEASLDEPALKAVSPAKRGRSAATRLDGGEHTRTLSASTAPSLPQHLVVDGERETRAFLRSPTRRRPIRSRGLGERARRSAGGR